MTKVSLLPEAKPRVTSSPRSFHDGSSDVNKVNVLHCLPIKVATIVLLYHMISMFYIIFTGNKITQYYGYKLFSIDNQYGPEITY